MFVFVNEVAKEDVARMLIGAIAASGEDVVLVWCDDALALVFEGIDDRSVLEEGIG